jgi:hypothetical protein
LKEYAKSEYGIDTTTSKIKKSYEAIRALHFNQLASDAEKTHEHTWKMAFHKLADIAVEQKRKNRTSSLL